MKPKVVTQIKINGEWVNKEDIPEEVVQKIVEEAIKRAAASIGFEVKNKTA